jgi:kynureninase
MPNRFWQPLAGWWGHAAPFEFTPDYRPAPGITRYLCGTQPILSMTALDCGLDTLLAAQPLGGMAALRAKSLALTDLFIALVEARCAAMAWAGDPARARATRLAGVPDPGHRRLCHRAGADRARRDRRLPAGDGGKHPDILRFGFTPLYIGFEDVWNAVEHLRRCWPAANGSARVQPETCGDVMTSRPEHIVVTKKRPSSTSAAT